MAVKQEAPVMKKLPAVKEGVRELGVEASVETVRKWVLSKYKLELTDAVAQNYVSIARREVRGGKKKKKKKRGKALPTKVVAAPTVAVASNGHAHLDTVVTAFSVLKGLSSKLGKENLAKLVESL